MTNQEILDGNRLIAEFDGMEFVNDDPEGFPYGYMYSQENGTWDVRHLDYRQDWNWLMPSIKQFINTAPTDSENLAHYDMHYVFIIQELKNIDIEATWLELVKAVKWVKSVK